MADQPTYAELVQSAMLGTARRELAPTVGRWLDGLNAVDPEAGPAEQLLTALSVTERVHRLQSAQHHGGGTVTESAPPEHNSPPTARLSRGLELVLEGPYPHLLEEAVAIVLARGTFVPTALLPALLPRAAAQLETEPERALRMLQAGGQRARWLAGQHPDWGMLRDDYDFAAAYDRTEQPAARAHILKLWRRHEPGPARQRLAQEWDRLSPRNQEILAGALKTGLTPDDRPWLRQALLPNRKGVRRKVTRLLLRSGDETTLADLKHLAAELLRPDGDFDRTLRSEGDKKFLKKYGGPKAPRTPGQWLLGLLPPRAWSDLGVTDLREFWGRLKAAELRLAARAIADNREEGTVVDFLLFLVRTEPEGMPPALVARLAEQLPELDFDRFSDQILAEERDALRLRGCARRIVLGRKTAWNERLTKAMLLRLLDDLHVRTLDYATQRDLAAHWKLAIPLVHPDTFPWMRGQLLTTTERYDVFGKLATELLQTTAFRRELARE